VLASKYGQTAGQGAAPLPLPRGHEAFSFQILPSEDPSLCMSGTWRKKFQENFAMSWGSSFSGFQLFARQVQRCGRWDPRQYTFNGPRYSPLSMEIWLWPRVTLRFTVLH
jgi:hypothetical protein